MLPAASTARNCTSVSPSAVTFDRGCRPCGRRPGGAAVGRRPVLVARRRRTAGPWHRGGDRRGGDVLPRRRPPVTVGVGRRGAVDPHGAARRGDAGAQPEAAGVVDRAELHQGLALAAVVTDAPFCAASRSCRRPSTCGTGSEATPLPAPSSAPLPVTVTVATFCQVSEPPVTVGRAGGAAVDPDVFAALCRRRRPGGGVAGAVDGPEPDEVWPSVDDRDGGPRVVGRPGRAAVGRRAYS